MKRRTIPEIEAELYQAQNRAARQPTPRPPQVITAADIDAELLRRKTTAPSVEPVLPDPGSDKPKE